MFAPCRGIASTVPVVGAVTEYPLPRCLGGALSPGQSASRAPVATAGSIGVSGTDATAIVARHVARRVPRAASRPLLAPGPDRQGGSWAVARAASRGRCLWFHKKDSFSLLPSPGNGRGGHRCLVLEVLVRSGCVCDGPPPPPCHTAEAQAPPAPLRAPPLAPVLAQEESSEVPSCSHPAALAGAQGWPQAGLWVAMSDTGCARSGDLRRPGLRGHLSPPAHGDAGAAG